MVALGEMPRGDDGEFTTHYQPARATTDDDDSNRALTSAKLALAARECTPPPELTSFDHNIRRFNDPTSGDLTSVHEAASRDEGELLCRWSQWSQWSQQWRRLDGGGTGLWHVTSSRCCWGALPFGRCGVPVSRGDAVRRRDRGDVIRAGPTPEAEGGVGSARLGVTSSVRELSSSDPTRQ